MPVEGEGAAPVNGALAEDLPPTADDTLSAEEEEFVPDASLDVDEVVAEEAEAPEAEVEEVVDETATPETEDESEEDKA
jgi:hypothetical protein